jgi:hypothetical protein
VYTISLSLGEKGYRAALLNSAREVVGEANGETISFAVGQLVRLNKDLLNISVEVVRQDGVIEAC